VLLPPLEQLPPEYPAHFGALVRRVEELPNGQLRVDYVRTGADDYLYSEVYLLAALELTWRNLGLRAVQAAGPLELGAGEAIDIETGMPVYASPSRTDDRRVEIGHRVPDTRRTPPDPSASRSRRPMTRSGADPRCCVVSGDPRMIVQLPYKQEVPGSSPGPPMETEAPKSALMPARTLDVLASEQSAHGSAVEAPSD
jgi:hypothetical protein